MEVAEPNPIAYPVTGEVWLSLLSFTPDKTRAGVALDFAKWLVEKGKGDDTGWIPLPPDMARHTLKQINGQISAQR